MSRGLFVFGMKRSLRHEATKKRKMKRGREEEMRR